jgi:hypothetical protein
MGGRLERVWDLTRKPWRDCATRHVASPNIATCEREVGGRLRGLAASHSRFIHMGRPGANCVGRPREPVTLSAFADRSYCPALRALAVRPGHHLD